VRQQSPESDRNFRWCRFQNRHLSTRLLLPSRCIRRPAMSSRYLLLIKRRSSAIRLQAMSCRCYLQPARHFNMAGSRKFGELLSRRCLLPGRSTIIKPRCELIHLLTWLSLSSRQHDRGRRGKRRPEADPLRGWYLPERSWAVLLQSLRCWLLLRL
jgi:hypothetical protein